MGVERGGGEALPHEHDGQNGGDEGELAGFDAEVEEQEREGRCVFRDADLAEGAGEAEAVEEAEGEGGKPWQGGGETGLACPHPHDLDGDEHDGEGDGGLDRRGGQLDPAEGGAGEREGVRDGEGGDGADEALDIAHQQEQREDEHQVIEAEQDVLDAEDEIGAGDIGPGLCGGDGRRRDRRV